MHALEEVLGAKFEELLGAIPWLRNFHLKYTGNTPGFDFEVALPLPEGQVLFAIECKGELRPGAFHTLVSKEPSSSISTRPVVPVLAMPFVSPRLADLCARHGWSWYDLAGNCRINVPNALYLERRGNKPVHPQARPKANLSTPEAARVIRALLAPENAGRRWTQRSMELHFGLERQEGVLRGPIPEPSLGLVNKVVRYLRDQAFIEEPPGGGFYLADPVKLLFAWRDAYRFDRHERRHYFTLLQGKQLRNALANLAGEAGGFAAYAAFSAAEFQAPHVRQPKTWMYLSREYMKRLESLLEAKLVESGENVVVLIPEDVGVFYRADGGFLGDAAMASTNPVQTCVDLFHCGRRGQEAAEALLEQRLKPEWSRPKPP